MTSECAEESGRQSILTYGVEVAVLATSSGRQFDSFPVATGTEEILPNLASQTLEERGAHWISGEGM